MSAMSNYLENALLDHVFRGVSYTPPSAYYFALFTAAPSDAGGGTEVTGGSYARVGFSSNTSNMYATDGNVTSSSSGITGTISNAVTIVWPTPTASWGVVTHIGVYDAPTGGNLLVHGPLDAPKTINNGDSAPQYPIGAFSYQIDN